MKSYHFDRVDNLLGIATQNSKGTGIVEIQCRAVLTSDDPNFYIYTEKIASLFLNKAKIMINQVNQFLVLIHEDLTADLYVNNFSVEVEMMIKKDIKVPGEIIYESDIADIRKLRFPEITIEKTDKIICCFKVGWRFGLFFDLNPRKNTSIEGNIITGKELDIGEVMLTLGSLYRDLSFYHVYKVLESNVQFEAMLKDGWFPFIEILGNDYINLSNAYMSKFEIGTKVTSVIVKFTKERVENMTEKWWKNKVFNEREMIIEAGVRAYLSGTEDGYINAIKNLWTEIEGILRKVYFSETGKGDNVKTDDLINHIITKAKDKSGSENSLFMPLHFLKYLKDVVFPKFSVENGEIGMSRNTSSHGVAKPEDHTQARALQLILILDQINYYI